MTESIPFKSFCKTTCEENSKIQMKKLNKYKNTILDKENQKNIHHPKKVFFSFSLLKISQPTKKLNALERTRKANINNFIIISINL